MNALPLLLTGAALAAAVPAASLSAQAPALAVQESFRRVVASVKPAVVSIVSVFRRSETESPFVFADPEELMRRLFGGEAEEKEAKPSPPRWRRFKGIGSGLITDPRGYVLTNEHVVGGAEEIDVIVRDPDDSAEKTYKGTIVGSDPASDLAVVKIEPERGAFPYAPLGDSDQVQVGDWAVAVGSPFGLEQTVTVGVISALRQSIKVEDRDYSDFFQTDAAINQGNSGGPLLDIQGRVIGVNTAIFSPTGVYGGVGFAIPSNQAARIMKELIDRGRVVRGWAGVEVVPLDGVLARQFKLPDAEGALVNLVVPDSPASKAGLRRGDVVVALGGSRIASPNSFMKIVERAPPGKRLAVRLVRAGRAEEFKMTISERPVKIAAAGVKTRPDVEGRSAAGAFVRWEGAHLRPGGGAGVVVVDVDEGSAAQELGLRPGDLIAAIDGHRVRDLPSFTKAARGASLKTGVVVDVNRRGQPLYLSFRRPL